MVELATGRRQAVQGLFHPPSVQARGSPGHEELVAALEELSDRHQEEGKVAFAYTTTVYFGQLADRSYTIGEGRARPGQEGGLGIWRLKGG